MTWSLSVAPLAGLTPGPGTARDWLREELAHREYQPSPSERFWSWVQDLLDGLRGAADAVGGFDPVVAVVALLVLVAGLAFALSRLRPDPGRPVAPGAVFTTTRRSAADHRAEALSALERGDWDGAVVESTRALAAGLFERDLLVEDAGATAHEITASAARLFPGLADDLARAAVAFDETRYGDRPADEARARSCVRLDERVRYAEPRAGVRTGPVAAVPR